MFFAHIKITIQKEEKTCLKGKSATFLEKAAQLCVHERKEFNFLY